LPLLAIRAYSQGLSRLRDMAFRTVAAALLVVLGSAQDQTLEGHTIRTPAGINTLASDWFLGGTVIPSRRSVVLSPGVPNRLGMLWSQYPLLTNNFEVTFTFAAKGPAARTVKEDGFALWYVNENATIIHNNVSAAHVHNQEEIIANQWDVALLSQGLDLFGYRSLYDGVGVFFCDDATKQPTVSVLGNNGKFPYKLHMGVPPPDAVKYDFRSGTDVTVKLRVEPDKAKVEVVGAGSAEIKQEMKSGGYLGLTIFGGKKGVMEPKEKSHVVELKTLSVVNYDKASAGESLPTKPTEPEKKKEEGEKVDVLHESSSYQDHRAESDAIKDLTNLVFKLMVESQPVRMQMSRAIGSLGKRIEAMEKTFEQLKVELDKKTGKKLGEEFDNIKKELSSLSSVASKDTQERHKRIEILHKDIQDVHKTAHSPDNIDQHLSKVTESNQRTLDQLTSEHQRMFGVSIAAIAFIVIAGLSLYNKFRCWEKKHVL